MRPFRFAAWSVLTIGLSLVIAGFLLEGPPVFVFYYPVGWGLITGVGALLLISGVFLLVFSAYRPRRTSSR